MEQDLSQLLSCAGLTLSSTESCYKTLIENTLHRRIKWHWKHRIRQYSLLPWHWTSEAWKTESTAGPLLLTVDDLTCSSSVFLTLCLTANSNLLPCAGSFHPSKSTHIFFPVNGINTNSCSCLKFLYPCCLGKNSGRMADIYVLTVWVRAMLINCKISFYALSLLW